MSGVRRGLDNTPPSPATHSFPTPPPFPYPVSMTPARKLPTLSNVLPSLSLYDNHCIHNESRICFSYPIKKLPVLALQFDITSETIRCETAPTGTNRHIGYPAGVPLLTPDSIPGDRGSAQHPYDSRTIFPPAMVIVRHLHFQTRIPLHPLPVCSYACALPLEALRLHGISCPQLCMHSSLPVEKASGCGR